MLLVGRTSTYPAVVAVAAGWAGPAPTSTLCCYLKTLFWAVGVVVVVRENGQGLILSLTRSGGLCRSLKTRRVRRLPSNNFSEAPKLEGLQFRSFLHRRPQRSLSPRTKITKCQTVALEYLTRRLIPFGEKTTSRTRRRTAIRCQF